MSLKWNLKKLQVKLKNFVHRFSEVEARKFQYTPKEYLKLYLPSNPVLLDCGAHDGFDSLELVKALGGTLHAVEAVPEVYEKLVKNTRGEPRIKCYNLALGNSNGKINFYVSGGNAGASSSILAPKDHLADHPDITFEQRIEADCLTLDTWAEKNKVNRIDFMWLDMQGAEKMMLEASKKILPTVKVIHCEVSMKETYDSVLTYPDFKKWMKTIGFRPEIEILPDGYDMGDVLFVRYA